MTVDLKSRPEVFEMRQRQVLQGNVGEAGKDVGAEMIAVVASP
ncbi:MAG TPA: hypothetical protein VF962_07600 [Gemmatimonadaceae bacterium]